MKLQALCFHSLVLTVRNTVGKFLIQHSQRDTALATMINAIEYELRGEIK
jgi:hypothetical protein